MSWRLQQFDVVMCCFQIEIRHGEMDCSVCSFAAKSQKDLENHLKRHADVADKPYFCTHCDARFSTRKVMMDCRLAIVREMRPGLTRSAVNYVTAINFILPLNLNTKCEFEYTKNLRRSEYPFAIN